LGVASLFRGALLRVGRASGAAIAFGRRTAGLPQAGPPIGKTHRPWLIEVEKTARSGGVDAAFALFDGRYRALPRPEQIALLRWMRQPGRPPNNHVGLALLGCLAASAPDDSQMRADAMLARARLLREMRRFGAALEAVEELAADERLWGRLEPWQQRAADIIAVYALTRLGEQDAAAERLAAPPAHRPSTRPPEEGVRLHCARRPLAALEFARQRGVGKLSRSAFAFYIHALERMGDDSAVEAALETEFRRKSWRETALLMRANAALRSGDRERHAADAKTFFARYGVACPALAPTDGTLPVAAPDPAPPAAAPEAPTLSVVMTTHNSAPHLHLSIASILDQSVRDLELLIVDDRSDDDGATLRILADWRARDPRIRLFPLAENVGTYRAKNRAIREARGRYVTCHDSDDFALRERFAREISVLEAEPGLTAVQSAWLRVTPDGRFVMKRWGAFLHENPASVMVRRHVFDEIGCFDGAWTGADTEFKDRIRLFYGAEALHYLRKPLTLGLHRTGSLTAEGTTGFDEDGASPDRCRYWDATSQWHYDCVVGGRIDDALPLRAERLPPFSEPP